MHGKEKLTIKYLKSKGIKVNSEQKFESKKVINKEKAHALISEFETTEGWEQEIGIYSGITNTNVAYLASPNSATGVTYYINWYQNTTVSGKWGSDYLACLNSTHLEAYPTSPYFPFANALDQVPRIGIKCNADELIMYINKEKLCTLNFQVPIEKGYERFHDMNYANKDLRLIISGRNHVYGGVGRFYFDPSLWTTNPEENMIPLNKSFADEYIIYPKSLKQY
jgi:hypothetical protein